MRISRLLSNQSIALLILCPSILWFTPSSAAPVDCSSLESAMMSAQHKAKYKYRRARKLMFTKLAPQIEGGEVVALYSAKRRSARSGKAPNGFNCEHLFPRAWMGSRRSKTFKYMEADLHNLFPSEIEINSRRGHLSFGEVKGNPSYRIGLDSLIGPNADGEEVIQPKPDIRGDISRALLYMALRWELPINKYQSLDVLQRWSEQDPPSQREERRDQLILELQGNRNPFVSCPKLVSAAISSLQTSNVQISPQRRQPQTSSYEPLAYPWLEELNQERKSQDTLSSRISVPLGAKRIPVDASSFGAWLRDLPLLKEGSQVLLYDGDHKEYQGGHHAVIDIDIGERDLQQCADAVMRFRAEYLFARQASGLKPRVPISFNYTTGDKIPYKRWRSGDRPRVKEYKKKGKKRWKVEWRRRRARADKSYAQFRRYLDNIFSYAGTASLSKELSRRPPHDIRIGDIYLRGGFPGHAVIVVDLAEHPQHGQIMLLAQSYMPAQSPHVLKNLEDRSLSPWFKVPRSGQLVTPEWTFSATNLYRFKGRDQD